MSDTRVRVPLNGKAVDLARLAAEVGVALTASDSEVVVADPESSVTAADLESALDAHVPPPPPAPVATPPANHDPASPTDAPSTYPDGATQGTVLQTAGWPGATGDAATLLTVKRANTRTQQWLTSVLDGTARYRASTKDGTGWQAWRRLFPVHLRTGATAELVSKMAPATSAAAATKYVVFSVPVEVSAGDILQVLAEFQVTNDNAYEVMVMSYLALGTSADDTAGTRLSNANGCNVTFENHHMMFSKVGTYQATADLGPRFVNFVAYAASSFAGDGDFVTVDANYGHLSVIQH